MNLKKMLKVSTSLMVVCGGFMSSFAQAEDYVTKSQVNVANGVAGLNGSKQVTAEVNNSKVITNFMQLNKGGNRLRFVTNSSDNNNLEVDMFYNEGGMTDFWGNLLDNRTFYFTNNRYGNDYKFNGNLKANNLFIRDNITAGKDIRANYMYIGADAISPYQSSTQPSLMLLSYLGYDNANVRPNTLMLGGGNRNSIVGLKASCQNTSGGDLGGSCYQFTDMGGAQTYHRAGSGGTDGINMDMRSASNSPLDSIGGNTFDAESYTLKGNEYNVVPTVSADVTKFEVKGKVECGESGSYCEMSGVSVSKKNAQTLGMITVRIKNYDASADITTLELDAGYHLTNPLNTLVQVLINVKIGQKIISTGYFLPVSTKTDAGAKQLIVKGTLGCGVGGGASRCEIAGVSIIDPNNQYIIDKEGYLLDSKVLVVNQNGEDVVDQDKYKIDKDGLLLDQNGNLLKTDKYFIDKDGYLIDENKSRVYKPVIITAGRYDPQSDTTVITLPSVIKDNVTKYYSLKNDILPSDKITITYYSADGVAYGVKFDQDTNGNQYALIYPSLSTEENGLFQDRMAIWTNISNGMASKEGGTNEDVSNIDMPNYYYGYKAGASNKVINEELDQNLQNELKAIANDTTTTKAQKEQLTQEVQTKIRNNQYTKLFVQVYYYPNVSGGQTRNRWRTINNGNKEDLPAFGNPLSNNGDQYDYKLTYQKYATDKEVTHNSNFHQYSQPTLFLGLNRKNFNLYSLQSHADAADSITREYDNEWDFWMGSNRGNVSSKGLTMTWSGSGNKKLPAGSYMMRMAGFSLMPTGLIVDGVWPYGGKTIGTDAGFFVFNNSKIPVDPLGKVNDMITASALGQARTGDASYQLFNYVSNDGNLKNKDEHFLKNNSLHFGLTKRLTNDSRISLAVNTSPTCEGNIECSVLGQIIFDPLNYVGGIALGSGQGENTKLGLIVDKDQNVIVNNKLTVNGKSVNDAIDKAENAIPQSQVNVANGVAGLNADKEVTNNIKSSDVIVNNKLTVNGKSVNDAIEKAENAIPQSQVNVANGVAGLNADKEVTNNIKSSDVVVNNKLTVNGKSVNDVVDNAIVKSQVNIANGVAGLNASKEVTANISSKQVFTPFVLLPNTATIRFMTGESGNNADVNIFYNHVARKDVWENQLDENTVYFTNNHYGNSYKFIGSVGITDKLSALKIIGKTFQGQLSTPSSSSESCTAGEFKDDINYHYVCVATNKWKRAPLSDF